ncbi:hypothetical protein [Arthrobacter sp. H20]|uniref:hypothetical protein n=1 Tax=Arthrobacter sp. H20 TaxID=1267981 RepID=UPI0004AD1B17|nr:hypothetical protein [Arthrobacter sp. H20]
MSEQNDQERDDAAESVGGSDEIDAGGYGGPGPENELPDGEKIKSGDDDES